MISFLLVLFQVCFVLSEKIGSREMGEFVLYKNRNPDMKIGNIKLFGKLKKVNFNKMQEAIGSDWPLGVVTYYLDANSYDKIIGDRLRSVMSILEGASCLQFNMVAEKPDNITYIHVYNPKRQRECSHEAKRNEYGEIVLVLGYDCLKQNEILHALLHAIGIHDEVTHPERDRFIRVQWNNIRPEYRKLYRIQARDAFRTMVEYDPLSIMHFHDRAFTSNGQATIVPLIPGLMIRPSEELSQLDKMKLRLLFEHECNKRKIDDILDSCKNAFHTNDDTKTDISDRNEELGVSSQESNGNNEALKDNIDDDKPDDDEGDNNSGNEKDHKESNKKLKDGSTQEDKKNESVEEDFEKNESVEENEDKDKSVEENAENNKSEQDKVENNKSDENKIENKSELRKRNLH